MLDTQTKIIIKSLVLHSRIGTLIRLFTISKQVRNYLTSIFENASNDLINYNKRDLEYGFVYFSRMGSMVFVNFFIEKGVNKWNLGMAYAAFGGHIEIIKLFNDHGADDWNWSLNMAIEGGGNMDLINFIIHQGANDWNGALGVAAKKNNKFLIDFFISRGAYSWDTGLWYAKLCKHEELIKFFEQKKLEEKTEKR